MIALVIICVNFILINLLCWSIHTKAKKALARSQRGRSELKLRIVDKLLNIHVHVVDEQIIEGVKYWYNIKTHSFLAQGKDVDAIVNTLQLVRPNEIFILDQFVYQAPDFTPMHYNAWLDSASDETSNLCALIKQMVDRESMKENI